MKRLAVRVMLLSILSMGALPASAEVPSFDPDQPFRESLSTQLLRSMLNRALDVLEEHVQIDGALSNSGSTGSQTGHMELKLYPKGKSQSDEHVKAEGWFSLSPESGLHDFHFRFKNPRERSSHDSPSQGDHL